MAINSAQGIASLYRGNPQPLQQSIQKDQQAKPGLPPDLQKMLALQIVTNEKDAAAAQAAMQQLKQMSGPTGQMPTVMQSLQQQAQQKMQAMGQQARQQAEQRGLPAGLMGVQGEPPQPEAQPEAQGIDQLPAEFEMAEGGIVAFQSRGEVPESEPASDSMGGFTPDATREALNALRNEEKYAEKNRIKKIEELRQKAEFLERAGAPQADAVRAQLELEERKAPESRSAPVKPEKGLPSAAQQPSAARPVEKMVAQPALEKVVQRQPTQQRPSSVNDIAALAKQMQASQPAAAPAPAPEVVDPATAAAEKVLDSRVAADPAVQAAAKTARLDKELGRPDTAQYDRLIAELEKRKQDLAPKQGYEGLMEFLGQVSANSQPGRGSFASGAAGARGMDKLNRERQLEQFELSKQAIDVSQKKLDTVRAYAEKRFNVGDAEFDRVYKEQFEAAQTVTRNKSDARKLAQEKTLKEFEMQQQATLERERMLNNLKTASINQTREYNEQARINKITSLKQQARKLDVTDPKAAAELRAQAADLEMAAGRGAASAVAGDRQELAELKALLKNAETTAENFNLSKATREAAAARMERYAQQIENMTKMSSGIDTGAPPSGKVPPPPPGFKVN